MWACGLSFFTFLAHFAFSAIISSINAKISKDERMNDNEIQAYRQKIKKSRFSQVEIPTGEIKNFLNLLAN